MMNDAMMLMKSRHNNTIQYLTAHTRWAFLLLALLVTADGAWGQIANITTGAIDSQSKVAEYNQLLADYPVDASSLIPSVESWTGNMVNNTTGNQHWNPAITGNYWEQTGADWNSSAGWTRSKSTTVHLPKGSYVLIGACRASAQVAAYISVNGTQVSAPAKGSTGTGIATDGTASFEGGTYSNNNSGGGWEYRYIKFDVTNDGGADVPLGIGGTAPAVAQQWMSFTQPKLYSDNGAFESGVPYVFELYNQGKYLNLNDGGAIISSNPQSLYLVKASDCVNYYITDGTHYLGLSGDTESLTTTGLGTPVFIDDIGWLSSGHFTLSYTNGDSFVGADNDSENTICKPKRSRNGDNANFNLWKIFKLPSYPGSLLSPATPQTLRVPVNVVNSTSHLMTEFGDDYNAIVTGLSENGTPLTASMMHTWNGWGAGSTITGDAGCAYVLNSSTNQPYGDAAVNNYADLSEYSKLVIQLKDGSQGIPRILLNRDETNGQWNEDENQSHLIDNTRGGWSEKYFTNDGNTYTVDLAQMVAEKGYAHLHAIKTSGGNVTVESMTLIYQSPLTTANMHRYNSWTDASQGVQSTGSYEYVLGRTVEQPFGDPAVNAYVDLSAYKKLVITMTAGTPRILMNRTTDNGQCNINEDASNLIEYPGFAWCDKYFTKEGNTYIVDLEKIVADKGFAHLHAIKGANWQSVNMNSIEVYGDHPTGKVYARLFVADKNTGAMADQGALTITLPSGWMQKTVGDTNYGYVYYGDASGLKNALSGITVSSANPLYQGNATVSLVVSTDFTRLISSSASSVSQIVAEPNWEKQYLVDFYKVDEYVGAIKSNGTEIREVVQLADASVKTTQLTKMANAHSQIISKLSNSSDKVYARLFVSDDAGDLLDGQPVFTYSGLPSGWTQKGNYGWVYYGDGFDASLLQGITVSASTPLPSSGAQVGLVVSSDRTRLEPSSPGSSTDIKQEPNWEVLYLNHFSYPFAGNMMYKVFSHSKEIMLTSSEINAGRTQIPLNEALDRIKSEYVKTNVSATGSQALADNLHIRWFVTYKDEIIANSEDYLATVATGTAHKTKTGYGIYWNSKINGASNPLNASSNGASTETINWLNMNFTKPDYGDWNDYKVVVWMSDDTSYANGQRPDGSNLEELTHEPNINMVYTYSFFVEDNFRFVHSKGAAVEAYPSLPYLIKGSSVQQYDWDNSTSSIVPSTIGDTRQDVHTLTYDVYLQPNSGLQPLKLSFQKYMGNGEVLEPAAYIRWYDWTTDLGTDMLSINNPSGSWLEKFTDSDTGNSRGLFFLNREKQAMYPRHSTVGVNFNTAALASLDENEYYEIACDVSKYYDGIYRSSNDDTRPDFDGLKHPYLLHEPTLSLRYIFRIHPASVIAGKILTGNNKLSSGITSLTSGTGYTNEVKTNMFNDICEDNGRVVVSLNNGVGKYALRANLPSLSDYYINSGNTQCDHITWKAYLEDASGLWERSGAVVSNSSDRIHLFELSNLTGTYNLLSNNSSSKPVTAATGMRFHMVGFVGDGSSEQAAIHYELEFIDAPAILVDDLRELSESGSAEEKAKVKVRRKDYLDTNMIFGGHVSFDEFFSTKTLANQNENHTEKPLPWEDAQYGYCYPQIDNYRIGTNDQSGLTPIHGDYILLKSICGTYSKHWDNNQPYKYFFWRPANQLNYDHVAKEELYDFTRLYGDETYGGFLYVDAADEARTIASLDFNAHLCTGSQITFTAAIADVTNGDNYPDDPSHYRTPPQLMIRVYGVDGSGKKTDKPVVSFLTGSLRSVSRTPLHYLDRANEDYRFMEWYQAYGYTTIPSNSDIQNYTTFIADIDNYCENTDGADYCVDEIRFYTSSGKVNVKMDGGTCVDEDMTFTANIDVEHLENRITLSPTVEKHLYYRIYEKTGESGGQVQYRLYPDNSIYNNGGKSYGDVSIWKYELDGSGNLTSNSHNANYVKVGEDLYFDILDGQTINLEQGKSYFIALTRDLEIAEANLSNPDEWSSPNDACDIYSNFFVPRKKYVRFLDEHLVVSSQTIQGNCDDWSAANVSYTVQVNVPDDDEVTGYKVIPNGTQGDLTSTMPLFDFFKVTTDANNDGKVDVADAMYELNRERSEYGNKTLLQALRAYREFERTAVIDPPITQYSTGAPAEGYRWQGTDENNYYRILKEAYDVGQLIMSASGQFQDQITETSYFLAIPVQDKEYVYDVDSKTYYLCDYIPFGFIVNGGFGTPQLALGFDDVKEPYPYPDNYKNVIRVGLEQLNKMRTQGYKLHVPVRMFKDKKGQTAKKVYFPSTPNLTVSKVSSDPNGPAVGTKFATIVGLTANERPYVNKTRMYLPLDLSGCAINFHEGYEYEVSTSFLDEDDAEATNPCMGDLYLVIKVVPEFVTWHAQHVDNDGNTTLATTDFWSANWYNDDNWKRSTRAELYKGSKGGSQNSASAAHPDGYDDNGEGSLSNLTTGSNPGFVPMKFTYVTLPSGNHAPSLINEPKVVGEGVGSIRQGGGFMNLGTGDDKTMLETDFSPNGNIDGQTKTQSSQPTKEIYFDMMVRYGTHAEGGVGCFGHRCMDNDGNWKDDEVSGEVAEAKVFDCEKFYGNVCKEIYFKPGSELLRPHRLEYRRAWVEKEVVANKWYLMSSPLKSTYAGDMYVPYSNGRQETEAFQNITFDKSKGYSRTQYPIYQRSWGTEFASNVYVKTGDIRANSYSANLSFATPEEENFTIAEWGHSFNDVQVPYTTRTGFSIRAHKKDQKDGSDDDVPALIRLPKDDTTYGYYDWTDSEPVTAPAALGVNAVDKSVITIPAKTGGVLPNFTEKSAYRFVTDDQTDYKDDLGKNKTTPIEINISDMQQVGDYILVGNPFMASIDMKKFFETNSTLSTDGYWTYEGSVAEAHAIPTLAKTTVIKPLQAFFVKKGSATKITFNKEMQIDGNFPTPPGWGGGSARQTTVTLSAANSRGSSSASLEVSEKASAGYIGGEDVETLFDSNLSDVPMVYTVAADGQAVSINQLPELHIVPFGVTCSSDDVVEVAIGGTEVVDGRLYVFDALTDQFTEVGEGSIINVTPNEYGRYYLTRSSSLLEIAESSAATDITVIARGGKIIVRSKELLGSVRVVTAGGSVVYSYDGGSNETSCRVADGIYIVEAETQNTKKTLKVIVR